VIAGPIVGGIRYVGFWPAVTRPAAGYSVNCGCRNLPACAHLAAGNSNRNLASRPANRESAACVERPSSPGNQISEADTSVDVPCSRERWLAVSRNDGSACLLRRFRDRTTIPVSQDPGFA